jgi:hypothetical protein
VALALRLADDLKKVLKTASRASPSRDSADVTRMALVAGPTSPFEPKGPA